MTTEEALDALVADLRKTVPDHRSADFSVVYRIVRHWFRVPIDDRVSEVFQLVFRPLTEGSPKLGFVSLCRSFSRPADGAWIQTWVTLKACRAAGEDWSSHCWYGSDFANPDDAFAKLETLPEFLWAASSPHPWHVAVFWQRGGEPVNPALVFDDLRRSLLH